MSSILNAGTIYRVYGTKILTQAAKQNSTYLPSLDIQGGTVDVYYSYDDLMPVSVGAMSIGSSDVGIDGQKSLARSIKWIAFEVNSGSPVVIENMIVTE